MYVRKEAVLSSQIEGTQSTLSELLEYEAAEVPGTPMGDVAEVSRYVAALYHGIERIESGKLPLSLRLLREIHGVLVQGGRGEHQSLGEFRRTQNWIGGTRPGNARYVPPPPHEVLPALDNLEKFLHDEYGRTPPLIKAGLAHAQFETIHPFLDGNGRVGRLLISLMFVVDGLLTRPFFYLSLYLRQNRADYYDALQRIRTDGDWEGWLRFYLAGVHAMATDAANTARAMHDLFERDRAKLVGLGRAAGSALGGYDVFRRRVVASPTLIARENGVSYPTALKSIEHLQRLGIVEEVTGRKWGRLYRYRELLETLEGQI